MMGDAPSVVSLATFCIDRSGPAYGDEDSRDTEKCFLSGKHEIGFVDGQEVKGQAVRRRERGPTLLFLCRGTDTRCGPKQRQESETRAPTAVERLGPATASVGRGASRAQRCALLGPPCPRPALGAHPGDRGRAILVIGGSSALASVTIPGSRSRNRTLLVPQKPLVCSLTVAALLKDNHSSDS
ncbi:uncharacterized protein LOC116469431 [Hylobates moloch]|uniref:uncharacterized protein LOC116469431 n=1 Tax=Hylobates moloch TaxID=81572 RepID=UPI002675F1DC|nr:uncharacterized protein LOC116469431 [Hylobates moloch]